MGYHTIKEGEQALVFNRGGQGRLVVGPRRVRMSQIINAMCHTISMVILQVFIGRGEIEQLTRYVANQNQYMEVKYRDGRKENEPGYVFSSFSPTLYDIDNAG